MCLVSILPLRLPRIKSVGAAGIIVRMWAGMMRIQSSVVAVSRMLMVQVRGGGLPDSVVSAVWRRGFAGQHWVDVGAVLSVLAFASSEVG